MKRTYLKIAIPLIILTVIAVSYFPSQELALPTYVIYPSENKSPDVNKHKIERLIVFESEEDKSAILSKSNNQIITTTSNLIKQIRISLKKCKVTKCSIDQQFYANNQSSSQNLKVLRREIENNFTREERSKAFNSIIVVIGLGHFNPNTSCRENSQSMWDELLYIKHTFGGLALTSNVIPLCGQIVRKIVLTQSHS